MKEKTKKILVIGGAGVVALVILSQKPADDAIGGAGAAVEKEKKPEEAGEDDTVFVTTTERAEAISGKKEVTAPEAEWESLFKTVGEYRPPTETSLATGAYERVSGAFQVLGPTHPESPYYATMGGAEITTHPSGAQTYKKGGSTILVPGTWEKAYLAGQHARAKAGQERFYKQQAFKKRLGAST